MASPAKWPRARAPCFEVVRAAESRAIGRTQARSRGGLLNNTIRIALVGDFDPTVVAHQAIPKAVALAASDLELPVEAGWVHSTELDGAGIRDHRYDALWCVPGSPYQNTAGVLSAIREARCSRLPFLGTCGGFQHAVLEIAESLWGINQPAHSELNPDAANPVIAPLACSLVEQTGHVRFLRGSRLAMAYNGLEAFEGYHCSYGLSNAYVGHLKHGPLRATSWDDDGDVRAAELDDHPFFVATLFQPERSALRGFTPPIVRAFLREVAFTARGQPLPRSGAESP